MDKGLTALIRLHTWRLDEKRRELADMERVEDQFRAEIAQIEGEVVAEQDFARQGGGHGFTFGGFALGVIVRRKKIEDSIRALQTVMDAKREEVAAAFRELKRYEIAKDTREKRERLEADRRTQAALDEVSLMQHVRKGD